MGLNKQSRFAMDFRNNGISVPIDIPNTIFTGNLTFPIILQSTQSTSA